MVLRWVLLQTVIQYQFFPGINLKYGTSQRLSGSHNSNTELLLKKIHKELIDVGSSAKSSGGFVKTLEEKKMKVKPVYDGHSDVQ